MIILIKILKMYNKGSIVVGWIRIIRYEPEPRYEPSSSRFPGGFGDGGLGSGSSDTYDVSSFVRLYVIYHHTKRYRKYILCASFRYLHLSYFS